MNLWFTIEANGKIVRNIAPRDDNGNVMFVNVMLSSPDELKETIKTEEFNDFIIDAFGSAENIFNEELQYATIHLTDHYGILIWSIAMNKNESGDIDYQLYDQRIEGQFKCIALDDVDKQ